MCAFTFLYVMLLCKKKTKTKSSARIKADAGVYTAHITYVSLLVLSERGGGCGVRQVCVHTCESNGGAAETAFTLHGRGITICYPGS